MRDCAVKCVIVLLHAWLCCCMRDGAVACVILLIPLKYATTLAWCHSRMRHTLRMNQYVCSNCCVLTDKCCTISTPSAAPNPNYHSLKWPLNRVTPVCTVVCGLWCVVLVTGDDCRQWKSECWPIKMLRWELMKPNAGSAVRRRNSQQVR